MRPPPFAAARAPLLVERACSEHAVSAGRAAHASMCRVQSSGPRTGAARRRSPARRTTTTTQLLHTFRILYCNNRRSFAGEGVPQVSQRYSYSQHTCSLVNTNLLLNTTTVSVHCSTTRYMWLLIPGAQHTLPTSKDQGGTERRGAATSHKET